jgi:hypothetical protein
MLSGGPHGVVDVLSKDRHCHRVQTKVDEFFVTQLQDALAVDAVKAERVGQLVEEGLLRQEPRDHIVRRPVPDHFGFGHRQVVCDWMAGAGDADGAVETMDAWLMGGVQREGRQDRRIAPCVEERADGRISWWMHTTDCAVSMGRKCMLWRRILAGRRRHRHAVGNETV